MQLLLATTDDGSVEAGYRCACGCSPQVVVSRGSGAVKDVCCCGTEFVVAAAAEDELASTEGRSVEVQEFDAPWGEVLEAAWAIDPGGSHHHH